MKNELQLHATQDEAQTLTEAMPWIDVLIVANDEQPATLSCERLPCSKETAIVTIVTNVTQSAAVGTLTVKINKERQAQAGVNRYHNVSEKITPNVNISHLLEAADCRVRMCLLGYNQHAAWRYFTETPCLRKSRNRTPAFRSWYMVGAKCCLDTGKILTPKVA